MFWLCETLLTGCWGWLQVHYRVVPGLTFAMCQEGVLSPAVKAEFVAAVKFLDKVKHVDAITGDCAQPPSPRLLCFAFLDSRVLHHWTPKTHTTLCSSFAVLSILSHNHFTRFVRAIVWISYKTFLLGL